MTQKSKNISHRWLAEIWQTTGLTRSYQELLALAANSQISQVKDGFYTALVALPGICAQSVGGGPGAAEHFTTAWLLIYRAAHLMDSIQDRDPPEEWWEPYGAAGALGAATGLYFSANLALEAALKQIPNQKADKLRAEFFRSLLQMSGGQFQEATNPQCSLDEYWEIAAAKSGGFFGLACWGGAFLGGADPESALRYRNLGSALGIMIQILDDLEDIKNMVETTNETHFDLGSTLPIVYAREVASTDTHGRLMELVTSGLITTEARSELVQILDQCGADVYIQVELERYRKVAINSLLAADPGEKAGKVLEILIHNL